MIIFKFSKFIKMSESIFFTLCLAFVIMIHLFIFRFNFILSGIFISVWRIHFFIDHLLIRHFHFLNLSEMHVLRVANMIQSLWFTCFLFLVWTIIDCPVTWIEWRCSACSETPRIQAFSGHRFGTNLITSWDTSKSILKLCFKPSLLETHTGIFVFLTWRMLWSFTHITWWSNRSRVFALKYLPITCYVWSFPALSISCFMKLFYLFPFVFWVLLFDILYYFLKRNLALSLFVEILYQMLISC